MPQNFELLWGLAFNGIYVKDEIAGLHFKGLQCGRQFGRQRFAEGSRLNLNTVWNAGSVCREQYWTGVINQYFLAVGEAIAISVRVVGVGSILEFLQICKA